MEKKYFMIICSVACMLLLMYFSVLAIPLTINYQGRLTDPNGNILTGKFQMTFTLYNAETDGISLWSEQQSVMIIDGIYNIQLGLQTPLSPSIFNTEELFLQVQIENEIFSPRHPLTSVAFAIKAKDAETLNGILAGDLEESDEINEKIGEHTAISDAHHRKTTSFIELTDTVMDSQVPDNITIDFASEAGNADKVDGMDASEFGDRHSLDAEDGSPVDAMYVNNEGNVGIGTLNPGAKLEVKDSLSVSSSNENDILSIFPWGITASESGSAIELDSEGDINIKSSITKQINFTITPTIPEVDNQPDAHFTVKTASRNPNIFFNLIPRTYFNFLCDLGYKGEEGKNASGNQFGLGVYAYVPDTENSDPNYPANYQKDAIMGWIKTNERIEEYYNDAGNRLTRNRDAVGGDFRGTILSSNDHGQVWAAHLLAEIEQGGDGSLIGMEINMRQRGSNEPQPDTPFQKLGILIVNSGSKDYPGNSGSAAIRIKGSNPTGRPWYHGIYSETSDYIKAGETYHPHETTPDPNNGAFIKLYDKESKKNRFIVSGPTGHVGIGVSPGDTKLAILGNGNLPAVKIKDIAPMINLIEDEATNRNFFLGVDNGNFFIAQEGYNIGGRKFHIKDDGKIYLSTGTGVNEFSTDGSLSDNSDDTIPTEKAVKMYVDNRINSIANSILMNNSRYREDSNVTRDAFVPDIRLIKKISTTGKALDRVSKLRGANFRWKDDESEKSEIGIIAQETAEIYTQAVSTNNNGYKSVDYCKFLAPLIEAIKDLKEKCDVLKRENETLKKEMESIKKAIGIL